MALDATSVASSATDTAPPVVTGVDHAVASGDVSAYREARRAERSGTPRDVPADSSPASTDDQPAASSPADADPPRTDKRATEHRIPELLTDRAQWRERAERAEREIAALKPPRTSDVPKAVPSPATVEAEFPEFDAWLAKPGNDGKSYTQYQRAFFRHEFEQAQADTAKQSFEAATKQDFETRLTAYKKSAETFIADHEDYWTVVAPITTLPPTPLTEALGDVILRSANPPALLYKLGTDSETWAKLLTLPERLAVYELGKIEAALSAPEKSKPPSFTRAKEPPTTLGRRSADPTDALEAAVANDDVAAYREAKLRARTAAAR